MVRGQDVSPGVRLAGEGATGYSFFVISDGACVTRRRERRLACPGDFFGEMALLGSGRRQATVETVSPARVLILFGSEFRQLQETHPGIAAQIEAAMQERLKQL